LALLGSLGVEVKAETVPRDGAPLGHIRHDPVGLGPMERVRRIIDHCAHPTCRDYLHRYGGRAAEMILA
jgi:hypothetical protein